MEHAEVAVAPPEGCPPPLRCRQVAQNWHDVAPAWTLPGSQFGTHGSHAGQGPPLYFLNAFGGRAELFTLIAWLLRDQFRCVLLDWQSPMQGCHDHGSAWSRPTIENSTGTQSRARGTRRWSLDDFAADVVAVADHLGDREFAVYGATFGAAVAARVAASDAGRVSGVVLQGTWDRRRLSVGERLLAWWHRQSTATLSTWPNRVEFQAANHRVWFPPLDPDRWAWFVEVTGDVPLALMSAQARALHGVSLEHDYARLACPVVLLATEGNGPKSIAVQERIAARHPQFRYEYLHSTGQHPYLTHPHRIAKLIKQHLAGEVAVEACCTSPETCASTETPA